MKKNLFTLIFLATFFVFPTFVFSQHTVSNVAEKIDKSYGKFMKITSTCMNREFPMLFFTPADYEKDQKSYPVVYMLHGVNDMPFTEDGLRKMNNPSTHLKEMAEIFRVIIVIPLVGNTYFMDSPVLKESKIATFISQELTAFIDTNFRTETNRNGRILCGFSMGGYGAVSLLCRYPDIFSVAIERGGVLNLATDVEDLSWDHTSDVITNLLGDYFTNKMNYHQNGCFNLVNHIRERKDIAFVIEVGKEDFLYKTNFAFHKRLNELKIPHIYNETEGGHVWNENTIRSLLSNLQYFNKTQYR